MLFVLFFVILGNYFTQKEAMAVYVAEYAQQLHDSWWTQKQNMTEEERVHSLDDFGPDTYVDSDLPHQLSHINLQYDRYVRDQFSLSIYYNVHTLHVVFVSYLLGFDCKETLFTVSVVIFRDFGMSVTEEVSVVKVPEDVSRSSQDTVDTVEWTAQLDTVFSQNRQTDSTIR